MLQHAIFVGVDNIIKTIKSLHTEALNDSKLYRQLKSAVFCLDVTNTQRILFPPL